MMSESRTAGVFSFLFHPLLIPTYGLIFLLTQLDAYFVYILTPRAKTALCIATFITTALFPSLVVFLLLKFKIVADAEIRDRNERFLPFLFTLSMYVSTFYMFRNLQISAVLESMILAATAIVFATLIITFFYKISAHVISLSGLFGILYGLSIRYNYPLSEVLLSLILMIGIMGWSRITIKAHTLPQVVWAFFTGIALGFAVMFFY